MSHIYISYAYLCQPRTVLHLLIPLFPLISHVSRVNRTLGRHLATLLSKPIASNQNIRRKWLLSSKNIYIETTKKHKNCNFIKNAISKSEPFLYFWFCAGLRPRDFHCHPVIIYRDIASLNRKKHSIN